MKTNKNYDTVIGYLTKRSNECFDRSGLDESKRTSFNINLNLIKQYLYSNFCADKDIDTEDQIPKDVKTQYDNKLIETMIKFGVSLDTATEAVKSSQPKQVNGGVSSNMAAAPVASASEDNNTSTDTNAEAKPKEQSSEYQLWQIATGDKLFEIIRNDFIEKIAADACHFNLPAMIAGIEEFFKFQEHIKTTYIPNIISEYEKEFGKLNNDTREIVQHYICNNLINIFQKDTDGSNSNNTVKYNTVEEGLSNRNKYLKDIESIAAKYGYTMSLSKGIDTEGFPVVVCSFFRNGVPDESKTFVIYDDDKRIFVNRTAKIAVKTLNGPVYYPIRISDKDKKKQVFNETLFDTIFKDGIDYLVNSSGIQEAFDEKTKKVMTIFDIGSIPTSISNKDRGQIISKIYKCYDRLVAYMPTSMFRVSSYIDANNFVISSTNPTGPIDITFAPENNNQEPTSA